MKPADRAPARSTPRPFGPALCGLLAVISLAAGCGDGPRPPGQPDECVEPLSRPSADIPASLAELDGLDFADFLEASYDQLLRRSPQAATELSLSTSLGMTEQFLDDLSEPYLADTYDLVDGILLRLHDFDRAALSADDQLSYDIYDWYLTDRSSDREWHYFEYPVTPNVTSVTNSLLLFLTDIHPVTDAESAWAYVERLRQVEVQLGQLIDGLRVREARGLIAPCTLLQWSLPNITAIADARPTDLGLYQSFVTRLEATDLPADQRDQLLAAAETAIACHVTPAFAALVAEVARLAEVAPCGAGVGQLPGGADYYAAALHHHTTTDLDADTIHQLGLDALDEIHAEMRARAEQLGYSPDQSVPALYTRVAQDSSVVAADQVVDTFTQIIANAEARLEPAFYQGPPIPVIVVSDPVGGFYVAGTPDGSRPGVFYARNGPAYRFAMNTLAYHETIPGHHLQLSLAQALALPTARRTLTFTGYVEGWALYAERLAADLGWYRDDPYGDLGRLQAEAFRAARLVVDTGIHVDGWSYSHAVDFMVEATGFSSQAMGYEVARYMAWPGQATAYYVGMFHLLGLREQAMTDLGDQFDLRDFHAAVLDAGAMPLSLLEGRVEGYLAR